MQMQRDDALFACNRSIRAAVEDSWRAEGRECFCRAMPELLDSLFNNNNIASPSPFFQLPGYSFFL
jgi:hypothetical protein